MSEDNKPKRSARRYHHLTPLERQAIFDARARGVTVMDLATQYAVSRQTIYNVIAAALEKDACTCVIPEGCQSGAPRQKHTRSRRIPVSIIEEIADIKRRYPTWGVAYIREHWIKSGHAPVSKASIYRILHDAGLQTRAQVEKEVYQRFEMTHPGQLWQMDIEGQIHLPGIGWVYGFAILDDFSRFCPGFRYFTDAKLSNGILLLNEAINKHGVPEKMYTDNGSQFASKGERLNNFELFCAANAIGITHTEPGRPQGKGKIERFYETVENQFITWVRVKIKEAPPDNPYTIEHLNQDLIMYLQDEYHARVHGSTSESPASRFFKESLRQPDPPVDVVKFLERETNRETNKYGEISFDGYKIQVGLPGYTSVKVVETLETIRIEHDEMLVREINKKDLSREPPIKRQSSNSTNPAQVPPSTPDITNGVQKNHARSHHRKPPVARKARINDPDENGIYHRTTFKDGRFRWKDHVYSIGSGHANEAISIQVSGDELIIQDKDGIQVTTLRMKRSERRDDSGTGTIDENTQDNATSTTSQHAEVPITSTLAAESPRGHFTSNYGPDKDGVYKRHVESSGKFWWANVRYYISRKYKGKSIRLQIVEDMIHVFDEAMVPLKTLKIRVKPSKS
nr:DDE-type integrase/transposase/recombinase [Candidatus Sigynarchaeum springense]